MNQQTSISATPSEGSPSGADRTESLALARIKYWKSPESGSYHARRIPRNLRRGRQDRSRSRLVEWHALAPQEREAAWSELLIWVTWLHDRYELSVESRLPRCWTLHPGLIEELWALKVWREEIYTNNQPSGQAARYWHAEMRQTIHAAVTFYAVGCRAGHKDVVVAANANPELQERWAAGDPLAGIPAALLLAIQPAVSGELMFMPDEWMREHIAAGRARYISATMRDNVECDGSWWYSDPAHPGGWTRNTDPHYAELIKRRAAKLAEADAAVARRQAMRNALDPAAPTQPTKPRTSSAGD